MTWVRRVANSDRRKVTRFLTRGERMLLNWVILVISIAFGFAVGYICREPEDDLVFLLLISMSLFFVSWSAIGICTGQPVI